LSIQCSLNWKQVYTTHL